MSRKMQKAVESSIEGIRVVKTKGRKSKKEQEREEVEWQKNEWKRKNYKKYGR